MNPCLFNNPGVKNIFQYLLLHLTSFSYLHIRETCIHPPCTNTHYQRLPPKDVDFNHSEWSPTCHSLFFFFFFSKTLHISLSRTVHFKPCLPDSKSGEQLMMVVPGFSQLTGTLSGFGLPATTTST